MPKTICAVDWLLTLEYLKVFLSWPVITLFMVILIIWHFKESIANLFSRITKAEGFGASVEAMPAQQLAIQEETAEKKIDATNETEKWVIDNPKQAIEIHQMAIKHLQFERLFNLIYGTQIDLLLWLENKAVMGETDANIRYFYVQYLSKSGNPNYPYLQYKNYLEIFGLMEDFVSNGVPMLRITPHGIEFLAYLRSNYPSFNSLRAY